MKSKQIVITLKTVFMAMMCGTFLLIDVSSAGAEVIIIANPSVKIDAMTKKEAKNIFLGKKVKWSTTLQIEVAILQGSGVHKEFTKEIVRKSTAQFKNWWRKLMFTGKGTLPKEFNSEQELMRYVADTEGAIGYISTATKISGVKKIMISD